MTEMTALPAGRIELFPPMTTHFVTDELERILAMLKAACPESAAIGFDFDGRLRVHLDVRSRGDVAVVQMVLPTLGGGEMFSALSLGATPHHPFCHRVSALVAC